MEGMRRLRTWRHPTGSEKEGFKQVRVERLWLSLPESENISGQHNERHRPNNETEGRGMRGLTKQQQGKTDARNQPGKDEKNIQPLDSPNFSIAVIASLSMNDGFAHIRG